MLGIDRRAGRARHDDAVHALVERRIGQEPALVALAEGRIEVQAVGDFPLDAEAARRGAPTLLVRSEEHTSELQSLMRISYAVFCLKQKKQTHSNTTDKLAHTRDYNTQLRLQEKQHT